jgi:hypothetical protein
MTRRVMLAVVAGASHTLRQPTGRPPALPVRASAIRAHLDSPSTPSASSPVARSLAIVGGGFSGRGKRRLAGIGGESQKSGKSPTESKRPRSTKPRNMQGFVVIAGAGFEPATFGL